jgi:hypothetical protein
LSVGFVGDIEFSLLVILELGVVEHLLGNSLASEEPDSLDVEVRLFSEDCVHGECVLSEVVDSLEESIHHVEGLIKNFTFTRVLVILTEVDSVVFRDIVVKEELEAFSLLVLVVDEEGLEVVEVELAGVGLVEFIKGINILLDNGLTILINCGLLHLGLGYNHWLLLNREGRLDGLGAELDGSESGNYLWELGNSLNPGGDVGEGLSESTIEDYLEGDGEGEENNYVSNGDLVSD